ncbi:MAG: hypothetical protein HKM93_09450 [Desulfobacteraceae bacterium]|nr:hypothetical protein [Desulfobacteraceae bacterium]
MGYLEGLKRYLEQQYETSVFQSAFEDRMARYWFLHGDRVIQASVSDNQTYDVELDVEGQGKQVSPKTDIKMVCSTDDLASVRSLVKTDEKVKSIKNGPIISLKDRHFIKNKTLYALMAEKQVVFFTLLEGEIIRGLIGGFTRYEITVNLKGGVPLILLRHGILDLRDKKKRCQLKAFQHVHRDWEKSGLFRSGSLPAEVD